MRPSGLVPEVHSDDSFRHPVSPSVDQDFVHMHFRRHCEGCFWLYDLNITVVPLSLFCNLDRRGVILRDAMLGLL